MQAFCICPFHSFTASRRASSVRVLSSPRIVTAPQAKASKPANNKKRPRSSNNSSGFASPSFSSANSLNGNRKGETVGNSKDAKNAAMADDSTDEEEDALVKKQRKLKRVDANGISLEARLREEIIHPLRKPKLTLFGTLAFSATLGFFFALGRLAAEKDSLALVSKNVAIDISAIALFGYLTWREVDFGRRSLNSIAGCPQPRDLPIIRQSASESSSFNLPFFNRSSNSSSNNERLSSALRTSDVVIAAGRTVDLRKYLDRCMEQANYNSAAPSTEYDSLHPTLVAFSTDRRDNTDSLTGATVAPSPVEDSMKDWINWLGDAIPPRRNIALFRIEANDSARESANAYVVTVDDPFTAPLPENARKLTVIEV